MARMRPCHTLGMSVEVGTSVEDGVVVVVGATGSMGSVLVDRLVSKGVPVLAVARSAEALEAFVADRPGVTACVADIGENDAISSIAEAISTRGLPVRMAVFMAGLPVRGSVDTIDPDLLAVGANIKLGGVARLLHACRGAFVEGSRFVAFAGSLGIEPKGHEAGPGAINAGLFNLMRQISILYGPKGVTVHTISSGPADTPRLRHIVTNVSDERGVPFEEVWSEYEQQNSLGRMPTPSEVAWAVTMLLEPEASVLHGSVLKVDAGGMKGIF